MPTQLLILIQYNDWKVDIDDDFAMEFYASSKFRMPPPAPVQCCLCCNTIMEHTIEVATHKAKPSDVRAAAENCRLCTMIVQALDHGQNEDDANISIVLRGPALRRGLKGSRLLRVYHDPGPSLNYLWI
jgi:hypothetical protein